MIVRDNTHLDHGVSVLVLDRPEKRNALSAAMRAQLAEELLRVADEPRSKVTVLTATGAVFSAGFDLSEFGELDEDAIWSTADAMHRAVLQHPVPLIAALDGPAYAGGGDLAVLADLRVGTSKARFAHPERVHYPVVFGPLADAVGLGRATELALTGRVIEATEARDLGLLTELVESEEPGAARQRAVELAIDIAQTPRDHLVAMKAKIARARGFDATVTTLDL